MQISRDLQKHLEWATASTASPESAMDPQTAALREAWIAWGRLLEAGETPMEPWLAPSPVGRPVRRGGLAVAAGLAAAVAIAAGTIWFAFTARRPDPSAVLPQATASRGQERSTPAGPSKADNMKSAKTQRALATAEPKWNDRVDDEIARVSNRLIGVQQDWHARADASDLVWFRLEQLNTEVESGQL